MSEAKNKKTPLDGFLKKILSQLIKIDFKRREDVVLVNGVAEQYESWFFNVPVLSDHFVVHWPNFYQFESDLYLSQLKSISIEWLVNRIKTYLDQYIAPLPCNLVASSAGCQTVATLASDYPSSVSKLVLICPSGLEGEENLPVIDGVSKKDVGSLISSIFYDKKKFVIDEIIALLRERFANKKWRLGFVKMAQVTKKNVILPQLIRLKCPTLVICGENDQIIPIWQTYQAVQKMRDNGVDVYMIVIGQCGHAPQIEKFQLTNKFLIEFLNGRLFKNKKQRFWRQDGLVFAPFDLNQASLKADAARKKSEHVVQDPALV